MDDDLQDPGPQVVAERHLPAADPDHRDRHARQAHRRGNRPAGRATRCRDALTVSIPVRAKPSAAAKQGRRTRDPRDPRVLGARSWSTLLGPKNSPTLTGRKPTGSASARSCSSQTTPCTAWAATPAHACSAPRRSAGPRHRRPLSGRGCPVASRRRRGRYQPLRERAGLRTTSARVGEAGRSLARPPTVTMQDPGRKRPRRLWVDGDDAMDERPGHPAFREKCDNTRLIPAASG